MGLGEPSEVGRPIPSVAEGCKGGCRSRAGDWRSAGCTSVRIERSRRGVGDMRPIVLHCTLSAHAPVIYVGGGRQSGAHAVRRFLYQLEVIRSPVVFTAGLFAIFRYDNQKAPRKVLFYGDNIGGPGET